MDTTEFLRLLWPEGDHFFVVEIKENGRNDHHHVQTVEEAAKRIKWREAEAEGNVYFALASYKQESYTDNKGKKRKRTQDNAAHLKCFWVDLDCKGKDDGTDYLSQKDALLDIIRFCQVTGLQLPTLTVDSGYGLHVYWVLEAPLTPEEWQPIANRWRLLLDQHRVRHDPACTTDSARILRPVGTSNRKLGKDEKPVRVIGSVKPTISISDFTKKLSFAPSSGAPLSTGMFAGADMSLNALADDVMDYRPSSIKEVVKECSMIREIGRTRGNVSEPVWHRTLGVVKFTTEAEKAIHLFSSGHPDYTFDATVAKADAWEAGPVSCAEMERICSSEFPGLCASCHNRGSVKGPIQLGYAKVMMVETAKVQALEGGFITKKVEVAAFPHGMDGLFKWDEGRLWRSVLDKGATKQGGKDTYEWVAFCDFLFFPSDHYLDVDNKHRMVWSLREREGVYREFELSGGALGAGGQALFRELGESGVTSSNMGGKAHMEAYITKWGAEIKKAKQGTETYRQFGWHGENFLLGDTLYKPNAEPVKVKLSGGAAANAEFMQPSGTAARWTELVNEAYNHEGAEPYQFLIGAGFGSILMPFMGVAGGLSFSATSYDTGKGKTTAARVAFSIYGDPREQTGVTLSKGSVTKNAIFAVAGTLQNLPVVIDEVTNTDGAELSEITYTFSEGRGKIRLQSNGAMQPTALGWSACLITTSNKTSTSIITGAKPGATAELARIIEYDCSPTHRLEKEVADVLFVELSQTYGAVGHIYARWVVDNVAEVKKMLFETRRALDKRFGLTGENRFWSAGYAVSITGLLIAKRLGLHSFDVKRMIDWQAAQFCAMKQEISVSSSTPLDSFSDLIRDLGQGLLITDIEGGRGSGAKEPYIIKEPRGEYTGRVMTSLGIGYLVQPVIHAWCNKRQLDMKAIIRAGVKEGWILSENAEKRYPGKGTYFPMGQPRCYTLDWARLEASTQVQPQLAEIIQLAARGK